MLEENDDEGEHFPRSRRPDAHPVVANPVAQTATVTYDRSASSIIVLRQWIEDCGYHCSGQSVPDHVCLPTSGSSIIVAVNAVMLKRLKLPTAEPPAQPPVALPDRTASHAHQAMSQ